MKTKKLFLMAAMLLMSVCTYAQSETPLKGDVNGDGKVDVADIVAVIEIMKNNGGTTETKYYWYVGQTDPSTMTEISPIVTSTTEGGGWYELGTEVPDTIYQLIKGGDATKYWYNAVPITSGTTLKPVASDMVTLDTSVETLSTKTFNGVTYQIYGCGSGYTRSSFIYAKK